jgi:hypothetical protein
MIGQAGLFICLITSICLAKQPNRSLRIDLFERDSGAAVGVSYQPSDVTVAAGSDKPLVEALDMGCFFSRESIKKILNQKIADIKQHKLNSGVVWDVKFFKVQGFEGTIVKAMNRDLSDYPPEIIIMRTEKFKDDTQWVCPITLLVYQEETASIVESLEFKKLSVTPEIPQPSRAHLSKISFKPELKGDMDKGYEIPPGLKKVVIMVKNPDPKCVGCYVSFGEAFNSYLKDEILTYDMPIKKVVQKEQLLRITYHDVSPIRGTPDITETKIIRFLLP